jgi:hypothetical protein
MTYPIAELPAFIMHIAAQFVSTDATKGSITDIHIQSTANGARIASTNGHFAFRCFVPFGDNCFLGQDELLVPASPFKKKIAYAMKATIANDEVRFYGGKKATKEQMELLEARPCIADNAMEFPRQFDSLWPDPASMENAPGKFIAFNASYMKAICDAAKWSDNGNIKMWQGSSPVSAMLLKADADGLELQWLLLPVMVRDC